MSIIIIVMYDILISNKHQLICYLTFIKFYNILISINLLNGQHKISTGPQKHSPLSLKAQAITFSSY